MNFEIKYFVNSPSPGHFRRGFWVCRDARKAEGKPCYPQ